MRKLQKFAGEQPNITTTYAGEFAGKYIAAALLSATTLDKKLITILPNVKYKQVLQKIAVNSIVNDASCNFVTSGTVALTERVIEPKELQVNLELCKQNFVNSWEALQLGYSAFDEIPKDFTDFLISYVGGTVAQATEQSIWTGAAATNGQFAGLLPALSASVAAGTGVLQATGSGAINSSNVLAKLDNVFQTIPNAVYGKEDLLIYVPTNVAKAYQQALGGGAQGANGYNNMMNVGEKPMNFNGVEIAMCPGMTSNYIVAAQKSNLYFGTGLMSDYNEVRVLDMAQIDGSQNFRIIMRYTAATQVGILSDAVVYIP
jgi:hypothetical protein